ncbi:hypothetical protein SBY92_002879 [Candida maltosa Xu316]|uniref:Uncharacterized protein n=1 Tax=Candida maltosa (strain Xu316) TaxID=1245528 RepID=M3IM09_CANMX|nr:hypothetical protein G210_2258 [Candida maltosa Xu316]
MSSEKSKNPFKKGPSNKSPILWTIAFFALVGYYFPFQSFFTTTEDTIDPKSVILQALETNLAGNWSQKYTSEPHLAGTNYGLVEWTEQKFKEYGLKTTIDTYDIYVSYPEDHDLKLISNKTGDVIYQAPLKEDIIDEDSTTKGDDLIPTFLGYAANGNVTAQYVYANYGTKEDFDYLKEQEVDVKGKIVVVRYGKIFRGLKVKFAQEHGAVGVLIYSDPGDDYGITPANGYKQYPHGPARQESSVQRGSVQFLSQIPGDPTTPGYPSKGDNVERKDPHGSIGKIPALPISYREVKPILKKLNGHGKQPKHFAGELEGFEYFTGPNKNYNLNLYNQQKFNITPLWNVYGEITGEKKDEVIIIGNHRDSWIKGGASDPNSGSAALLEVARALNELSKQNFKFKRTIVFHSYDGEEYGLLGSTEQGEYYADKYQRDVVAYLNLDDAVSGKHFKLNASPTLNHVLLEIAKQIDFPEKDVGSLYDHWLKTSGKVGSLGSGSDYTVYLDHLGIPSVDFGFVGGKGDPVYHYHSNYDSYHWISKFGDKDFVYHNVIAKFLALLTLELSEHEVINFKLHDFSKELEGYFNDTVSRVPKSWLHKTITDQEEENWDDYEFANKVSNGQYPGDKPMGMKCHMMKTIHNQKHNYTLADLLKDASHDLGHFKNVTRSIDSTGVELQSLYDDYDNLPIWKRIAVVFRIRRLNKVLKYFERSWIYRKGLDNRFWFRHIVYASGRYTGYAGQTLPGLNEAIEDGSFDRFVKWVNVLSRSVKRTSSQLNA